MRVNSISSQNTGFYGKWVTQPIGKFVNYNDPYRKRHVYIPDKDESVYSIAQEWKKETGLLPIDWVKENNPYNQSERKFQYEIAGSPYMPLNVLKASVEMKYSNLQEYDNNEKINKHIELAKLAALQGDHSEVKIQEQFMIDNMKQIIVPKLTVAAAMDMDNYKDKFGSNSMYAIRYGKL